MDLNLLRSETLDEPDRLRLYFLERLERIVARRRGAAAAGLTLSLRAFDRALCSTYEDLVALGAPDDHLEIIRIVRGTARP